MVKKYRFTIIFLSWMLLITFFSLYSFSGGGLPDIEIPHSDKIVHFIFYFVAVVTGSLFIRERTKGEVKLNEAVFSIGIIGVFYGIIIEALQTWVATDRSGDLLDVFANSIGVLGGALLVKYIFSEKTQLKWKY